MNSPLSSEDLAPASLSESFDFELFLPPGNPFSLESFDFELFLPPGNPFSLKSIGSETSLSPVPTFLSGLSQSLLLKNAQVQKPTSVEESEFGDLFGIDILTTSSGEHSRWLVLSTFDENDEVIRPAAIKVLDDQDFQWINFITRKESPVDISMMASDMFAEPSFFIGVINGDIKSDSLFIEFSEVSAQNLLNMADVSSMSSI